MTKRKKWSGHARLDEGDPLAMPMYALGVVPLINTLSDDFIKQVWYADDATACGCLSEV